MRGWYYWHQWSDEGLKRSLEEFQTAIDLDPGNAPAHAGLSLAYTIMANNGVISGKVAEQTARLCAEEASRLDPALGEAKAALATCHAVFGYRWAEAETAFREAIRLNPSFALGYYALAQVVLLPHRRFDEALQAMRRGRELDPLSVHVLGELGFVLYGTRRGEEGIGLLTPAIELHPDVWFLHEYRGLCYLSLKRYEEAYQDLERGHRRHPSPEMKALLAFCAALGGRRGRAFELHRQTERLAKERYVAYSFQAVAQAALGDLDTGMDLLERALDDKEPMLRYVTVGFGFECYWEHPRFPVLLEKLRLPNPLPSDSNS